MKSNNKLKNPSKKYIDLVNEGYPSPGLFPKKKKLRAIEFFKSNLNDEEFVTEELASGYILVGYLYQEIKDYESASFYFDKGYSLGKGVLFSYDSGLKKILKTYLRAHRKDLYDYWRSDFLKRSQYDKKFNRLMNS
ncbi:hypothetical protein [Planomicrobium sp. CPCC 101079]|uniref:hypothetical protein n=1 Tax=Planomicrobium sp. CPCC 101079 TaxID=2599618 RepID=UPI0011B61950|nr:hypothetical protein [Planomicrobium sp. CPCC 101079]TWT13183.1 hypothetical protein FQV28_03335 [Planomicrobium sp. CPCC 101079]